MSKYVCENCKKQIENEADSLIIDKMSGSGEVDGYLAICPECLKKMVPEAREECKSCLYYEICNVIGLVGTESTENIKCVRYKDRSRFVELPTAHWIRHTPDRNIMREFHKQGIGRGMSENSIFWTCSNCGSWGNLSFKYCPFCSAKIEKAEQALKERNSE